MAKLKRKQSEMKTLRLIDQLERIDNIEVPYHVWTALNGDNKAINFNSWGEVCLGGDYKTILEARKAIEWYVDQLGGKVKWNK